MSERAMVRPDARRPTVSDANVLVPNALRDTLLRCAETGFYDVHWSATTLREVERTLLNRIMAGHPERSARVSRVLAAMQGTFPAATVVEDQSLIASLQNDPKDRHVLAAAI